MKYEIDLCEIIEKMPELPRDYVRVPDVTAALTYQFPVCPENTSWMMKYICFDSTCENLEIHIISWNTQSVTQSVLGHDQKLTCITRGTRGNRGRGRCKVRPCPPFTPIEVLIYNGRGGRFTCVPVSVRVWHGDSGRVGLWGGLWVCGGCGGLFEKDVVKFEKIWGGIISIPNNGLDKEGTIFRWNIQKDLGGNFPFHFGWGAVYFLVNDAYWLHKYR